MFTVFVAVLPIYSLIKSSRQSRVFILYPRGAIKATLKDFDIQNTIKPARNLQINSSQSM